MRLLRPGAFHQGFQIIRRRNSIFLHFPETPARRSFCQGSLMAVFYKTAQWAPLYSRKMKMRTMGAAILFTLSLMTAGDKPNIAQLAWLAGCWEGQTGPVRIEEHWSKPAGGAMLGLSRNIKDGKVIFSEFMRINQDNGKIVYTPRIGTKAAPVP